MSRKIRWSMRGRSDFLGQLAQISSQSAQNAALVRKRVQDKIIKLAHMPTGHKGRVAGTFETVVHRTSLILVYNLPDAASLQILRVIHAARDWKEGGWPQD